MESFAQKLVELSQLFFEYFKSFQFLIFSPFIDIINDVIPNFDKIIRWVEVIPFVGSMLLQLINWALSGSFAELTVIGLEVYIVYSFLIWILNLVT